MHAVLPFKCPHSSFSGLPSTVEPTPLVLEIDISSYLYSQDYQYVKKLLTVAKSKNCYLNCALQSLSNKIISGEIVSPHDLTFLKYELELSLENIYETDPQLENILSKNFKTFKDDGENQQSEIATEVTVSTPTPAPSPTSHSLTVNVHTSGLGGTDTLSANAPSTSPAPANQPTSLQSHHAQQQIQSHHHVQHTTPQFPQHIPTSTQVGDSTTHSNAQTAEHHKRSYTFKNLGKLHKPKAVTPPPLDPQHTEEYVST